MRTFTLNTKDAAEVGQSRFITETGKYIGKFVRAEFIKSTQETDGIELDFVADDGRRANFLSLWLTNVDGRDLYGKKVLSAIMACLKLRTINEGPIKFQDKDGNEKRSVGLPDLMNKPIGVLLQREEYQKDDGSTGYKFNINAPFNAETEQTASEVLKSAKAEQLAGMVASLADRKPRQQQRGGFNRGAHDYPSASGGGMPENFDPNIPF